MAPTEKVNGEDESSSIDGDRNNQQHTRRITHTFRRRKTTTIRGRRLTEYDDNDKNITIAGEEWEPTHQEEQQHRREAVSSMSFFLRNNSRSFSGWYFQSLRQSTLSIYNK